MDVGPDGITITTAEEAERLLGVHPELAESVAAILSGQVATDLMTRDKDGTVRPMTREDLLAIGYDFKTVWPFNEIYKANP